MGLTQAHPNYKCKKETPNQTYTSLIIMKLLFLAHAQYDITMYQSASSSTLLQIVTMYQFNVVVNMTVVMGFCKTCNGVTLPLQKWGCNFAISFGSTSATASHV